MNHDKTYKKIQVIGCSSAGIEDAIRNAARRAHQSVRNLRWFEVKEIRGEVEKGEIAQWQVDLQLAFTLDEDSLAEPPAKTAIAEGFGEVPSGVTLETRPRRPLSED